MLLCVSFFTTTDRVLLPIRVDPKLPIFVNINSHNKTSGQFAL